MQHPAIQLHPASREIPHDPSGDSARRRTPRGARQLLLASAVLAVVADPAAASEGGASHYVQGMGGDFAMALIGPAGWYVRNDLVYMDADIGPVTRGRFQLSSYDQQVWVNATKLIRLFEDGPFCGRMGVVLTLPYALSVDASGTLAFPAGFTLEGEGDGLADPSLTVFANWNPAGKLSYSAGVTAYSDFGDYDPDRLLQYGRNYWSYDLTGSLTWLDPQRGREFSITGGYMMNEENPATDYETGDEFHLDLMLAQHLSAKLGIGLAGYFYQQVSDDKGSVVGVLPVGQGGFRAEGAGLGPAIKYTLKVGDTDLTIIGKWLRDVHSENRLDYSNATLSFAFRL